MPKTSDRDRLARIEADQRKLADTAESIRRVIRSSYGDILIDMPVEKLTEREFKDIVAHCLRLGGRTALTALKAVDLSPERRPSDEHGGAARRRPASLQDGASADDGDDPLGAAP